MVASRSRDGYAVITATTVTPGNTGDAAVDEQLIAALLHDEPDEHDEHAAGQWVYGEAAVNLARLAALRVRGTATGWAVAI